MTQLKPKILIWEEDSTGGINVEIPTSSGSDQRVISFYQFRVDAQLYFTRIHCEFLPGSTASGRFHHETKAARSVAVEAALVVVVQSSLFERLLSRGHGT